VKKRLINKGLGKYVLDQYSKANQNPKKSIEKSKTLSKLPAIITNK